MPLASRQNELTPREHKAVVDAAARMYRRLGYAMSGATEKRRQLIVAELAELAIDLRREDVGRLRAQAEDIRDRVDALERKVKAFARSPSGRRTVRGVP